MRFGSRPFLASVAMMALPQWAFAFGTLSIQPAYFPRQERFGGIVGLYVQEQITGPLSYDSWTGIGQDFNGLSWNGTNHNVAYNFKRVSFAVGLGVNLGQNFDQFNPNVHTRVQVKLWK